LEKKEKDEKPCYEYYDPADTAPPARNVKLSEE